MINLSIWISWNNGMKPIRQLLGAGSSNAGCGRFPVPTNFEWLIPKIFESLARRCYRFCRWPLTVYDVSVRDHDQHITFSTTKVLTHRSNWECRHLLMTSLRTFATTTSTSSFFQPSMCVKSHNVYPSRPWRVCIKLNIPSSFCSGCQHGHRSNGWRARYSTLSLSLGHGPIGNLIRS